MFIVRQGMNFRVLFLMDFSLHSVNSFINLPSPCLYVRIVVRMLECILNLSTIETY
jgi:hypothetical protein